MQDAGIDDKRRIISHFVGFHTSHVSFPQMKPDSCKLRSLTALMCQPFWEEA